jgi:hypothetical protein
MCKIIQILLCIIRVGITGGGGSDLPQFSLQPPRSIIFYELGSVLTLPVGPSFQFIHAPGRQQRCSPIAKQCMSRQTRVNDTH